MAFTERLQFNDDRPQFELNPLSSVQELIMLSDILYLERIMVNLLELPGARWKFNNIFRGPKLVVGFCPLSIRLHFIVTVSNIFLIILRPVLRLPG